MTYTLDMISGSYSLSSMELIKNSKKFLILIGFILYSLSRFNHVANNLSEPIFHSELEDEISTLSTLSAKLGTFFFLS